MLNLNDSQVLSQLMVQTKQKWRSCKRKQYNIYACKMTKDLVFANKLEQPDSYNAMRSILGKYVATVDECRQHPDLMHVLGKFGFYQTDGSCITLCGTAGELWTVKEDKLKSAYMNPNGRAITSIPKGWFTVTRAAESTAQAVGIYIPSQYIGVYKTDWGAILQVNNPKSDGHNIGDILVAPLINGQPNLADCSPTNNTVFARTYDLAIGGWGRLGIKSDTSTTKTFTLEDCKKLYGFKEINKLDNMRLLERKLNSTTCIKFKAEYYDLEKANTVWLTPIKVPDWLYKDSYIGVFKVTNGYLVTFRNIYGEGFDFDSKSIMSLDGVVKYINDFLNYCKNYYEDYIRLFNTIVNKYGNENDDTTGEDIEDAGSIHNDGTSEGMWIGLSKSLLSRLNLSESTDAYMGVLFSVVKDSNSSKPVFIYNIWLNGDGADRISERIGKPLDIKDKSPRSLFTKVESMISTITK